MGEVSPKSQALNALFWRSEILRVMYWLRGEGLGDLVDPVMLERFLGLEAATGLAHLYQLADDGYVVRDGDWFALSDAGLVEGEAEFATAFSDLLKPSHGSCSDECWCQMSPEEAAACARQRRIADEEKRPEHEP